MLHRPKKTTRRWLTLVFIVSFLLNIQSSYACAMMPDMEQEQTTCCCGPSHRMDDVSDHQNHLPLAGMDMAPPDQVDAGEHLHDQICNDPQMTCCEVEVSVGINDPPDDGAHAIGAFSKITPHKIPKQVDSVLTITAFVVPDSFDDFRKINLNEFPPDSYLHYYSPPLYKTTERYRI